MYERTKASRGTFFSEIKVIGKEKGHIMLYIRFQTAETETGKRQTKIESLTKKSLQKFWALKCIFFY